MGGILQKEKGESTLRDDIDESIVKYTNVYSIGKNEDLCFLP